MHTPVEVRRRGGLTAGLLVLVLALSAGCAGSGVDVADPPSAGTGSSQRSTSSQQNAAGPSVVREQGLQELLQNRADAVLARDRQAFAATLDDPTSAFGQRQLAVFDSLAKLPLGTFEYGTPEPAPALSPERAAALGPDAWVSRVRGRYTIKGFDTASRTYETHLTAVRRDDGWKLADDADGGTQAQLWDLPDLQVLRGKSTLVVASGAATGLQDYVRLGDEAVSRVSEVWKQPWGSKLVLVVPATVEEMAAQLGQQSADVDQVAAVTDGPLDVEGRAGADRIVLNPKAFERLRPSGQRVVVTHETTHVAIRASTSRAVPLWLSEGLADYVGYSGLDIGRREVADALLARVRAGQGPKTLPTAADFDPARTTIAPGYNAAWLAVSLIADTYGQDALVALYQRAATRAGPAAAPGDPDRVLRDAFPAVLDGATIDDFTESWLRYLERLARQ